MGLSSWLDMISAQAFAKHARKLHLVVVGTHLDRLPKTGQGDYVRKMRDAIERLLHERQDPNLEAYTILEVSVKRGCLIGM